MKLESRSPLWIWCHGDLSLLACCIVPFEPAYKEGIAGYFQVIYKKSSKDRPH
jgi:hypothetical protein